MVDRIKQLAQLEGIARIKAERQLKAFAAFALHMNAAHQRADAMRTSLAQSYSSIAPLTIPEARAANAQARRSARELRHADQELQRLQPRFDAARKVAATDFGRAEALLALAAQERRHRDRERF
ncbi:hypothetical protein [Paracoccus sp. JM45]|uniref:hypothetical protein n=1 Tax=Paracoccus sp. JM45 TaxID=2283626 RepID=UPI000E6CEBAE|nr:hypothetical protein [Paracoccus sp. JM45]RJE79278.1 hypothetical protein DWB67_12915 [Paracoccus sp. JM45]